MANDHVARSRARGVIADAESQVEGERPRIDEALRRAHRSRSTRPARGIPGLRRELFPAAAWRREVEGLAGEHHRRTSHLQSREEARVIHLLAALRAEDILAEARAQAQRLVGTAAAVARARREQAERAAVHTIEEAEKAAAAVAAEAEARVEAFASSAQGARELHRRVLQLHASLSAPESRLDGAVSVSHDEHEDEHVIDLAAIEAGEAEVRREKQVAAVESVVLDAATDESGVVPKSRFQVPGVTPGSIEAFRDELAP